LCVLKKNNLVYVEFKGEDRILKLLNIALPYQKVLSLNELNYCYASIPIKRHYYYYASQFHVDEIYIGEKKFLKGVLTTDISEDVSPLVRNISTLTKNFNFKLSVKSKILEYLYHKRKDLYGEIIPIEHEELTYQKEKTERKEVTNLEKEAIVNEYLAKNDHRYKTEDQKKQFRDTINLAKIYTALIDYEEYF